MSSFYLGRGRLKFKTQMCYFSIFYGVIITHFLFQEQNIDNIS